MRATRSYIAKTHTLLRPGLKRHVSFVRGDHFHRDFPSIPQIMKDWSSRLHNPVASTSESHVDCTPSTSGSEAHGKKGKLKFPCKLCEGDHAIQRCPFLDEEKRVLEDRLVSPIRLPCLDIKNSRQVHH